VFVVASSRDDINPTEILFEFEGVRRDTPQSRKEGKVTPTISSSGTGVSRVGFNCEDEWFIETPVVGALDTECGGTKMNHQTIASGHIFPVNSFYESSLAQYREANVSGTIKASGGVAGGGSETFLAQPIAYNITFCDANGTRSDRPNGGLYVNETDVTSTLTKAGIGTNVAQPIPFEPGKMKRLGYGNAEPGLAFALRADAGDNQLAIATPMAVRRLTPIECERLQGFPDNYSNIPWRKAAESPDGPRYKALGNSWAVPVVAWIGKRIQDQLK
jgi:DNA (cytosine-5)-methyltransferase 1